jgi:outer membrane biosynthesis protein TonB
MSERAVFLNCIGISAILHTAMFAVAPIPAADMAHAPKRSLVVAYQKNITFIAVQKESISLINIPGETFKSPEYKSYYQIIREKIKREAYAHYKNLEEGEVFLSFILASDGSVKDLIVNNQKTTASPSLIDIANRSVKESSPFPGFPEKLKTNPQLSFNVIISFEFK